MNKKSAVAAIDETLKNVKTELTNLFPGSTIYADAEKCFNNRMASLSGNTDITQTKLPVQLMIQRVPILITTTT